MPTLGYLALSAILLALGLQPSLVKSYDCENLQKINDKCPIAPGPRVSYPNCLVAKYSVSAFIQCADAEGPDAPTFAATQGGEPESVSVLDVLTDAVNTVACESCPLAGNIRRAADKKGPNGNFAKFLCDQSNPVDAGICCLRECLNGVEQEHSIEALCSGRNSDLMNTPLVPQNCVSNKVADDSTDGSDAVSESGADSDSGSSSSSNAGSGDSDSDTITNSPASSSSSDDDTSTPTTDESSIDDTSSSTSSTSATPSNEAGGDTTSASSPPPQEAEGASSVGSESGKRFTYMDYVKVLGATILPLLAMFR
ncbi:MAG: hypothetical protein Q9169_008169 [Polycauliona sp. 2 TL-2023]